MFKFQSTLVLLIFLCFECSFTEYIGGVYYVYFATCSLFSFLLDQQEHGGWNLPRDLTINFIMKASDLVFQKLELRSKRIDISMLSKSVPLIAKQFFVVPGALYY